MLEWMMYDDEIDVVVRRRKGVKGLEEKMIGDEMVEIEKNMKSRKLEEIGYSKDEF